MLRLAAVSCHGCLMQSASFWKCMKLDESAESQLQRLEGGEDEDDDDMGPLAAAGCLRAISTILNSVASIPQLYPQMEPCLVPILHRMMSSEGEGTHLLVPMRRCKVPGSTGKVPS